MTQMAVQELVTDLIRYAGTDEDGDGLLRGDPADLVDMPLPDLGFDSLAVLNTLGRIERDHRIKLDDETVTDPKMTLGELLAKINAALPS